MKTKFLLLTILIIGSMAAYSQTTPSSTKASLEQAKTNPKTREQQAKADVHVVKKTPVIVDTTVVKSNSPNKATQPQSKKSKSKKS